MKRFFAVAIFAISLGTAQNSTGRLPAAEEAALTRIDADALHADLNYLASDELAGRDTPSPGLELAADFIASRFRREGLEPAGPNGSYFQVAEFERITPDQKDILVDFKSGDKEVRARARVRADVAIDYQDQAVVKLSGKGPLPEIGGNVVVADERRYGTRAAVEELQSHKPKLIVLIGRERNLPSSASYLVEEQTERAPLIQIRDSNAEALFRSDGKLGISVHVPAPVREEFPLRNVAAILRGSDPVLREQYVVLSAHYDHLGQNAQGIFHGADDNASGTASVIEIANALATLNPRPKRSILFLTFFGEEKGLLGSYYYTHHPLVPLKNTVANINLEQMGRTDDVTGSKVGTFFFTGQSFSNLPAIMGDAAKPEGVRVYRRGDSDDYFERSDNFAFAQVGIVDHTIAVAAEFPGYHGLGDTLDRIDFANMAKVDRGVAAGIAELANQPDPPRWGDSKEALPYKARRINE